MSVSLENKLPEEFRRLASESLGPEAAEILSGSIGKGKSPVSVRLNPRKLPVAGAATGGAPENASLIFGDNVLAPVKWASRAFYLKERPLFTLDPLFHAGVYYVQEASSMYMDLVAGAIESVYGKEGNDKRFFEGPLRALDLCAAPGGKTTHLLSLLNKDSLLVSNEVIKSRAVVLADNVAKWGADNVVVTRNDPKDFSALKESFHLAVVDAPCSGEGLFGKDREAIGEWSLANVKLCSERQRRILTDIWPAVKPGGFLVYSTCTYNRLENDGNVAFLVEELGAERIKLEIPPGSGIIATEQGGMQFVPGLVEGEGQFVALLRKPLREGADFFSGPAAGKSGKGGSAHRTGGKSSSAGRGNGSRGKGAACGFLPEGYIPVLRGELLKGYPASLAEDIFFFESKLRPVLSGVAVATPKGKDFIPHPDLAMLPVLPGGLYTVEVTREDALKFLAKEPLVFPGRPLGYLLLTYRGCGLGFVKNIGNRSNNLLPVARRIRMNINEAD